MTRSLALLAVACLAFAVGGLCLVAWTRQQASACLPFKAGGTVSLYARRYDPPMAVRLPDALVNGMLTGPGGKLGGFSPSTKLENGEMWYIVVQSDDPWRKPPVSP